LIQAIAKTKSSATASSTGTTTGGSAPDAGMSDPLLVAAPVLASATASVDECAVLIMEVRVQDRGPAVAPPRSCAEQHIVDLLSELAAAPDAMVVTETATLTVPADAKEVKEVTIAAVATTVSSLAVTLQRPQIGTRDTSAAVVDPDSVLSSVGSAAPMDFEPTPSRPPLLHLVGRSHSMEAFLTSKLHRAGSKRKPNAKKMSQKPRTQLKRRTAAKERFVNTAKTLADNSCPNVVCCLGRFRQLLDARFFTFEPFCMQLCTFNPPDGTFTVQFVGALFYKHPTMSTATLDAVRRSVATEISSLLSTRFAFNFDNFGSGIDRPDGVTRSDRSIPLVE